MTLTAFDPTDEIALNRAPVIISLGGDHSVTGAILPPFIEKYGQKLRCTTR
jgi:arginase family enzyme